VTPPTLLFNPSRLETAELEATFVGRQALLERLERDLLRDRESQTSRHWLLIGLRGMGKSHLVELLSRRLRDQHGWDVVRMPEEHYQVASLADLLEQIVTRLADGPSPLADEEDPERVELRAIDLLRRRAKPTLVVIENLGSLLAKLDRRDQHRLRELLMLDAPFTLVTTAPGPVEATTDHGAPFYDFFQIQTLEELTREEVRELIRTRIQRDGRHELLQELGRFDALYHFAGGNPRLALALYGVLQEGVTDTFYNQMLELLDRITPYYQARLADISPQMARVLTEMALAEGPLTPSEIARRTRLKTNQVTANVAKLVEERLVRATGRPDQRRRYYEVVDRLFRIWLQMREDRSSRKRFRFLAEFFEAVYAERREAAWQLAERLHLQHWRGVSAGDMKLAREAARTLEHLAPTLGLKDEDVRAEDELMQLEGTLAATTEPAMREALALKLVEGWDRLGRAERAFPALSEAVRQEPLPVKIWLWHLALALELGQPPAFQRTQVNIEELSKIFRFSDEPLMGLVAVMRSLVPRAAAHLVTSVAQGTLLHQAEFQAFFREQRAWELPSSTLALLSDQGDQGLPGILQFLARGYRGGVAAAAVLSMLPTLSPASRDKLVSWLGEHARDWAELQKTMTRHGWFDSYAILRASGYLEPIAPLESALTVRDAPDRAAALAALHPEEREAVLILLEGATPGTGTSSSPAARSSP
jgi:DNA-binding MarR family transcriptional regulator